MTHLQLPKKKKKKKKKSLSGDILVTELNSISI